MKKWAIGIDVGGTSIKFAFVDGNGCIHDQWDLPTDRSEEGRHIPRQMAQVIGERLAANGRTVRDVLGIGIGAPGFLNMETGFVYHAVNIGWRDFPLKQRLQDETGLPVIVDNDANIAALGEMWKGAGEGARDLICVTLGTGVGGGIVVNGDIVHGTNGMGGEIGHITVVEQGGVPCNCGRYGCLETVASATGIVRIAKEKGFRKNNSANRDESTKMDITAKDVLEAAKKGDAIARDVVEESSQYLGRALSNLAIAINPQKIVIGGGVSKAGDTILRPIASYFRKYTLSRVAEGAEFAIATRGNDAGVIGGAWLVMTRMGPNAASGA